MMKPSLSQTVRAAQQAIEQQAKKQRAPMVLWAGIEETPAAFTERLAIIRKRWKGRLLAAVPYGWVVPTGVQAVEFSPKMFWLLNPEVSSRYRVASGGRGSGKSHGFADSIILDTLVQPIRALMAREIQRSLKESVHRLLCAKIDQHRLAEFFEITDNQITCLSTGAEIIFAGLYQNISALKSLEGINRCWIEESESVSQRSLEILPPTIRAAGSEIYMSCNPDQIDAPVQQYLTGARSDTRHVHVIYSDNPWFGEPLESERVIMQRTDDDLYSHIWLGNCRSHSDAQVFKGKYVVEEFTASPHFNGPYYGCDWGFSQSPTTLIRCWVYDDHLWIDHEAYAIGCDIDRTPALFDTVPGARDHVIRSDSARPETISFMQRAGYPKVTACEKGKGSVEDGISHIRKYERVIIHPRCVKTLEEFRLYSYKVDRLSGDVLPDLIKKYDHLVDSLRYALEPLMKPPGEWVFGTIPL